MKKYTIVEDGKWLCLDHVEGTFCLVVRGVTPEGQGVTFRYEARHAPLTGGIWKAYLRSDQTLWRSGATLAEIATGVEDLQYFDLQLENAGPLPAAARDAVVSIKDIEQDKSYFLVCGELVIRYEPNMPGWTARDETGTIVQCSEELESVLKDVPPITECYRHP